MNHLVPLFLAVALSVQGTLAFSQDTLPTIPPQNKEMGTMPAMDNVDALAQKLFSALQKNDAVTAQNLFFPEAAFVALKDIKDPKGYYKQLIAELERDVAKQHAQLTTYKDLKYASFKRGGCKWKAIGTEYNKIPYWSCYRNRIIATAGSKEIHLDLKTLINWGDTWYITHLGREIK